MFGLDEVVCRQKDSWDQMGIQGKTGADGSVQRYKARLVAQGFTQQYGTDFDETFCSVVRQESLQL